MCVEINQLARVMDQQLRQTMIKDIFLFRQFMLHIKSYPLCVFHMVFLECLQVLSLLLSNKIQKGYLVIHLMPPNTSNLVKSLD